MSLRPTRPGEPGFQDWKDLADAVDSVGVLGAGCAEADPHEVEREAFYSSLGAYFLPDGSPRLEGDDDSACAQNRGTNTMNTPEFDFTAEQPNRLFEKWWAEQAEYRHRQTGISEARAIWLCSWRAYGEACRAATPAPSTGEQPEDSRWWNPLVWLTNDAPLHPLTANLVVRFARALATKLADAEKKYGYSDGWKDPHWMDECRAHLLEHVAKGDPRDVAAYCAFLWHHGESTAPQAAPATGSVLTDEQERERFEDTLANKSWSLDYPTQHKNFEQGHFGYKDPVVREMWWAWQARAILAAKGETS